MKYIWSDETQEFHTPSAYQHWARTLMLQDEQGMSPESEQDFIEPLILKLIVGQEFDTIEQARLWLRDRVIAGDFLMDGYESQILAVLNGEEDFTQAVQQAVEQKLNSDADGEIYTVYRTSRNLLDEDDIKRLKNGGESDLDGRAEVIDVGQAAPIEDSEFEDRRSQILPQQPAPQPKRGNQNTPIVAVIDDGIGFLNDRFRTGPVKPWGGTQTRFHAIWLQSLDTIFMPVFGQFYVYTGQVLFSNEINDLLARGEQLDEEQIYRELNTQIIKPGRHRSSEFSFTHGTHVLDVAAGADPASNAPERDWPLLAVQLPSEAVNNTAGTQLEPAIVQGVRWILAQARQINDVSPVVINISFGTLAGPKDGTKYIERLIEKQLRTWQHETGRCARVILSNGNGRLRRQVARFELTKQKPAPITWRLQPDDNTACFAEIRTDEDSDIDDLQVSITTPSGDTLPLASQPPGTFRQLTDGNGHAVARLYHVAARALDAQVTTPAYYLIATAKTTVGPEPRAEAGGWTVTLAHQQSRKMPVRIEVQRGETPIGYRLNGRQSYLDDPDAYEWEPEVQDYVLPVAPITRSGTHSSFTTAADKSESIASVGASEGPLLKPARYSGQGAPWSTPAPTASAIAEDLPRRGVLASGTFSGSVRQLNGTSVAAGRMTHCFAKYFAQEGCTPNGRLMRDEMEAVLNRSGTIIPPGPDTPQTGLGVATDRAGSRGPR